MLFCDFCLMPNNNLRRIQSSEDEKGYILTCKTCETKQGLEQYPTYVVSDLIKFIEENRDSLLTPKVIKSDDESEYLIFSNNLQYLTRKELKFIADEIYKTLQLDESLDKFIENNNFKS